MQSDRIGIRSTQLIHTSLILGLVAVVVSHTLGICFAGVGFRHALLIPTAVHAEIEITQPRSGARRPGRAITAAPSAPVTTTFFTGAIHNTWSATSVRQTVGTHRALTTGHGEINACTSVANKSVATAAAVIRTPAASTLVNPTTVADIVVRSGRTRLGFTATTLTR